MADGSQPLDTVPPAVKLWERVMKLDRYAPSAEQRWNELVFRNAHGLAPFDEATRGVK